MTSRRSFLSTICGAVAAAALSLRMSSRPSWTKDLDYDAYVINKAIIHARIYTMNSEQFNRAVRNSYA